MAKHLTTRQKLTRDLWLMAVIIAEIVAIVFLLVAIPQLWNDAENLAQFLKFAIELARIVIAESDS